MTSRIRVLEELAALADTTADVSPEQAYEVTESVPPQEISAGDRVYVRRKRCVRTVESVEDDGAVTRVQFVGGGVPHSFYRSDLVERLPR